MASHHPRVGVGPQHAASHEPPMAGISMTGMAGSQGHVDSAAGDIGYKPETHARYQPQAGRADRLQSNIVGDAMLGGKI